MRRHKFPPFIKEIIQNGRRTYEMTQVAIILDNKKKEVGSIHHHDNILGIRFNNDFCIVWDKETDELNKGWYDWMTK